VKDYLRNPLAWDLEEEPNPQLKKAQEEQESLDFAYAQTFATTEGKRVLEHLRKHTIEAGTWLSSLPYEKAIAHGFAREGQNALVRNIEQRIERGRNGNATSRKSGKRK
jgi:hypothetical protein